MAIVKDYTDMRQDEWEQLPILAQRIRILLTRDQITLHKLGESLGIAPSVMKGYTEKQVDIGISALVKIADAFNVSTDYLLGRTDCPAVEPDVQAAIKYTGLSSDACDLLNKMLDKESEAHDTSNEMHVVLSNLISCGNPFWLFLLNVWGYKLETIALLKVLEENPRYKINLYEKNGVKGLRYSAIEQVTKCIDNYIDSCTADKIDAFNQEHPEITVTLTNGELEVEENPGQ